MKCNYDGTAYRVVRRIQNAEGLDLEIRQGPGGAAFFCNHGDYKAFLKWRSGSRENSQGTEDILDDMRRHGCPGKVVSDLRRPLDKTKAMGAASEFVSADRRDVSFLVMLGPTGVGKSVAAGHVMREFGKRAGLERPSGDLPPVYLWMRAAQITGLSSFDEEDKRRAYDYGRAGLLVVDELGREATAFGRTRLTELLLARHSRGAATVLTGNLKHSDFREGYGAALVDRINECGLDPDLSGEKSLRGRAA